MMSTDYDLDDDTPSPLTDDGSARQIHVGERPRERRSLTRKTASLGRSKDEEEEEKEYERFTGQSEYRRALFEEEDHDNRYRHAVSMCAIEERRRSSESLRDVRA